MMQYLTQDTDEDDGSMVSPTSSADSMHQNLGVQQQQQQMLQAQQRQNQNGIFQVSFLFFSFDEISLRDKKKRNKCSNSSMLRNSLIDRKDCGEEAKP